MISFFQQARATAEDLVLTKSGGSVSVPEPPTHPHLGAVIVFSYGPPYGARRQIPGAESKDNPPTALSAMFKKDGGLIYATDIGNKIVRRAFDLPGAGEQDVLFVALDNAMWNDEAEAFYHHGHHLYNSVPSKHAVLEGRKIVMELLCNEAAKDLGYVLFMGDDNAHMNRELARAGNIPGVPGSRVEDVTKSVTDAPRPFGLVNGSALKVFLPGAAEPQVWISVIHAGSYPIYMALLMPSGTSWYGWLVGEALQVYGGLPTNQLYQEVPKGINSAMKALRTLSGRPAEGAVPWAMVRGGGEGMQEADKAEMGRMELDPDDVEDVAWYYRHKGGKEGGQATQELRADMDLPARPGLRHTSFGQEAAMRPEEQDTALREQCGGGGREGVPGTCYRRG